MSEGVSTVLVLILIVLKIVGLIDWSWWWVLAPIWVPAAGALALVLLFFVCAAIAALIKIIKGE